MKKDCTLSSLSAPQGFCSYKPTSLNVDSSILLHGYTDVRARADMLKFPQTPCSLIRSRCLCLDDGWHFLIPSGETSTHRQYAIEAYTCRSRWLVNPLRFRALWLAGGTGLCSASPNMKIVRLDRSTSQLSIEGATRIQNLLDLLQLVATRFGEPQWFTLQAGPSLTGMLTSGMESRRLGVSNQKGCEYVHDSMRSRLLGATN